MLNIPVRDDKHLRKWNRSIFKLYAMVDQGAGKHEADLRALEPAAEELVAAGRWAQTHDPSEGFRAQLRAALSCVGVEDEALDL